MHKFQEDTLTGIDSSLDISTEENLEKLVRIGEKLLKKPVSRINLENGVHEQVEDGVTNEEALKRFICHLKSRNYTILLLCSYINCSACIQKVV